MRAVFIVIACLVALAAAPCVARAESYPVVDTGLQTCFGQRGKAHCPGAGQDLFGQDAQYQGHQARYRDNGDGTVSDLVTGLMWVKARGKKMTWNDAVAGAKVCTVGGHSDWRAPTIKELYSLIDFRGSAQRRLSDCVPYIDARYFEFRFGNTGGGERLIDCQDWSATRYVSTTMYGSPTAFGVNFADGRIKGYPMGGFGGRNVRDMRYMRYVRGNPAYGHNDFKAKGDVVADAATGLTWQRGDSGTTLDWAGALNYCETLRLDGHDDWRLPNAKELQTIVDYGRSPATTGGAAIDPVFHTSAAESYYWTGTTHLDGQSLQTGNQAVYVTFGRALGYMAAPGRSGKQWIDVHGAGAQRSDPKFGRREDYPQSRGPQGDDVRVFNYVRCVRGGEAGRSDKSMSLVPPWSKVANTMGEATGTGGQRMRMGGQGQGGRSQGGAPGGYGQSMGQGGQGMGQGMGPGGRMGPPQEAFDACSGKASGASCAFQAPHGTVSGTCGTPPMGGEMVCMPAGGPPGMGRPRQQ